MGLFDIFKKKNKEEEKPNLATKATFTCRHIMNKECPIGYVACDADGDIQVFCDSCGSALDVKQVMVVDFYDIQKKYEGEMDVLNLLQGLEQGQAAQWSDETGSWVVKNIEANEYSEWLKKIKSAIEQENVRRNKDFRCDYCGRKIHRN